jgi:xylulokinase
MTDLLLTVDCSTTSAKATVWNGRGEAVSEGRAKLDLSVPAVGQGEQNPLQWREATESAIADAIDGLDTSLIRALCFTHQREGFVCVDEGGDAIRPAMLWLDTRAKEEVRTFGTQKVHEISGKPPNPTPAYYKLLWLRTNEPETIARTAMVTDVHGYLVWAFTGEFATSVASADPLGLIDLTTGDYDDALLADCGVSRGQVPCLVDPGKIIGQVTADMAAKLGLPAGLPVVAGAGDGQCAGLGAGIVEPGSAYLNLGTGLISGSVSDNYVPSLAYRAMAGCVPGTVNYELFIGAGTFMVTWFLSTINQDSFTKSGGHQTAEEFWQAQAATIPLGSEGLIVVPYWMGALTPYWEETARGILVGFTPSHSPAHIYRAILEGIACELRLCVEQATPSLPQPLSEFVVMGGGATSDLWCQMIADVVGAPLVISGEQEATSLGAAMLAAVGAGLYSSVADAGKAMSSRGRRFEPRSEQATAYDEVYEHYRAVYPALRSTFREHYGAPA